jgi:hypothetical protein
MRLTWGLAALTLLGCLELSLPPPPGAGSISGSVVYFKPGRATPVFAEGAKVVLKGSSVATTSGADGLFRLEPIVLPRGEVLISFDSDADGKADRQRLLDVATLGGGPGKTVALGQVTLNLNGTVSGRVVREEVATQTGGHRGTTVLVPEGPYATTTADDGSYLLPDLPEGPVTVAFFRDGYDVVVVETTTRAGQDLRLQEVHLARTSGSPTQGAIRGRIVLPDGAAAAGVVVHLGRSGAEASTVTTQADGVFRFEALAAGPYDVAATKQGFSTATLRNVLVAGGETAIGDLVLAMGTSTPPEFTVLPDAGVLDAGGPSSDAGRVDGGGSDAGSTDAGTAGDAGVTDSGFPFPEAVITPSPVNVAIDDVTDGGLVTFTVDGARSIGQRPLEYTWQSLDVGDGLLLVAPPSTFSSRATFAFSVTPSVRVYRVRLYVTDPALQDSNWTEAQVRVAYRPIAVLTPSVTTVGTSVRLSCAGSSDPGALQLTHRFLLLSGAATLQPQGDVVTVTSMAPGVVTVACEVENDFGLVSARSTSVITFTGDADAGLSVTVSAPQAADAGTVVTLTGAVVDPPGPVSASWSEVSARTPVVMLATPAALTTTFVTPSIVGGDQVRRFKLEVRAPPLCTGGPPGCLVGTAETTVTLLDRRGPVATLASGSTISRFGSVVVDFDEAATVPLGSVRIVAQGMTTPVTSTLVQESPTRVRLSPEQALAVGPTWELRVSDSSAKVTDGRSNQSAAQVIPFTVRAGQAATTSGGSVSTLAGAPRVSVSAMPARPGGPAEATAVVAARRDDANGAVLYRPVTATAFSLTEDPLAPTAMLSGAETGTRRGHVAGSRVFATLAVASGPSWSNPLDGALFTMDLAAPTATWTRLSQPQPGGLMNWPTSMPGQPFSDGSALFTIAGVPSGVMVARQLGNNWPDFIVTPSLAESLDPALTTLQPGLTRAAGVTFQGTRTVVVANAAQFVARRSTALGTWMTTPAGAFASGPKTLRVTALITPNPQTTVVAATPNVAGSDTLQLFAQANTGSWATVAVPAAVVAPTPGFDLVNDDWGTHLYLAAAVGGKVFVWRRFGTASASSWELLDGRNADQSLNDAACQADQPELSFIDDGLFVAWSERCAGAWRIGLARVD